MSDENKPGTISAFDREVEAIVDRTPLIDIQTGGFVSEPIKPLPVTDLVAKALQLEAKLGRGDKTGGAEPYPQLEFDLDGSDPPTAETTTTTEAQSESGEEHESAERSRAWADLNPVLRTPGTHIEPPRSPSSVSKQATSAKPGAKLTSKQQNANYDAYVRDQYDRLLNK